MKHFQHRGWTQPCCPGSNFSPVCNTKLYQNQTRDYMTKFSTLLQPAGLTQFCHVIVSTQGWNYSWVIWTCVVVTIYYKKTKWRLFTSTIQCRERIVFQPGGLNRPCNRKQNSTRRADFNPVVESAPCNRPLSLQFLRGITMRNMCLQCSQGIQQHVYSGFVWTL
jgi:hypothetical protein